MRKLFKVAEQTSWQIFGKIVSSLSTFTALSLITRNYIKDDVGVYTLATTYLTMFFIISDLGLNAYVITKLTDSPSEANKLFNARLYWSFGLMIIAVLLSFSLPLGSPVFALAVVIGSISIIGNGIFTSCNLIFQQQLKYERSIIGSSIGALVTLAVICITVFLRLPIYLVIVSLGLGWMVNGLAAIILAKSFYRFKLLKLDFEYFHSTLEKVWPISLTLILNVVYFRFDSFILAATRNLAEVGIYNLSFTLFQTALVVPTFIMNSYYPIILKELHDKTRLYHQVRRAFGAMIVLSIIGTFLTWLLSPFIINLIGGGNFSESTKSLNILAVSFPAFFGSALLMWLYVSFKRYKVLLIIYLIGMLINISLDLIFVPQYSYIAASWITVFGEYLILILQLVILWLDAKRR